jgi:hypothetical protein
MQKSLPTDTEEKEIFKTAPTHDKKKQKKITVDSFVFHSPLFSGDNFADRQIKSSQRTDTAQQRKTERQGLTAVLRNGG